MSRAIYGHPHEAAGYGYVNVPKAACTSIHAAIALHHGTTFSPSPQTCSVKRIVSLRHLHWFSVVRHPCDRLVSLWADYLTPPYPTASLAVNPDLAYFVDWPFEAFVRAIVDREPGQANAHYMPQTDLLYYLDTPLTDQLLHFETLAVEWEGLRERCGVPALPHLRPSEHQPWQGMYSPDLLALVARRYAADFEQFGYKVEL